MKTAPLYKLLDAIRKTEIQDQRVNGRRENWSHSRFRGAVVPVHLTRRQWAAVENALNQGTSLRECRVCAERKRAKR